MKTGKYISDALMVMVGQNLLEPLIFVHLYAGFADMCGLSWWSDPGIVSSRKFIDFFRPLYGEPDLNEVIKLGIVQL